MPKEPHEVEFEKSLDTYIDQMTRALNKWTPKEEPKKDFSEDDHPRDENGQFTDGDGGGGAPDRTPSAEWDEQMPGINDEARQWAESLDQEELNALHAYSGEAFLDINHTLWGGEPHDMSEDEVMEHVNLMTGALERAPSFEGTVFRGTVLQKGHLESLEKGSQMTLKGFTSTTLDAGLASEFMGASSNEQEGGEPVMMEIKAVRAKVVEHVSGKKGEYEALLLPGTKLRILSVKKSKGAWRIKAEEHE